MSKYAPALIIALAWLDTSDVNTETRMWSTQIQCELKHHLVESLNCSGVVHHLFAATGFRLFQDPHTRGIPYDTTSSVRAASLSNFGINAGRDKSTQPLDMGCVISNQCKTQLITEHMTDSWMEFVV